MRATVQSLIVAAAAATTLLGFEAANISGHWVLNSEASKWGRKKPPQNVALHIQHQEPKISWTGELTQGVESQGITFRFEGTADGKEYTTREGEIERKAIVKREDDRTISTRFTSMDGKSVETSTIFVSRDGKRLTRRITMDTPDEKVTWVEVYDRQ